MRPISQISKKEVGQIKMVVFDVDGVLVPRGTKIKQVGQTTTLHTKVIAQKQIEQIKELNKKGFLINISSGRGLYMLEEMFREVLPFVSLTYENGSATWYRGKIYQHINSFEYLRKIFPKLKEIKNKNIKGFEPKEFIITIHCKKKVPAIERVVKKEGGLYTIWNGEAYDIGIKKRQTKALGLRHLLKIFKLKRANVMAIGDNYNEYLVILSIKDALELAQVRELDLIEITPNANPPVAKIMDFGKYQYEADKKLKKAKAGAKHTETKSVQIKIGTGDHDLALKARTASGWLEEGQRDKEKIFLAGRAKYMEERFLRGRLDRLLHLITENYKIADSYKRGPKGLTVTIERSAAGGGATKIK